MKKEIINNEITLLEYEDNIKINKNDIDINYNCLFKICPICKCEINLEDKMCFKCEENLLKEEEYIYFKEYSEWLDKKEDTVSYTFDSIAKEMENEIFKNNKVDYEKLKEKVKEERAIIENKNIYVILKGNDKEALKNKYGIENIYSIKEIDF